LGGYRQLLGVKLDAGQLGFPDVLARLLGHERDARQEDSQLFRALNIIIAGVLDQKGSFMEKTSWESLNETFNAHIRS
jgi:hypothetical protein